MGSADWDASPVSGCSLRFRFDSEGRFEEDGTHGPSFLPILTRSSMSMGSVPISGWTLRYSAARGGRKRQKASQRMTSPEDETDEMTAVKDSGGQFEVGRLVDW